MRNLRSIAGYTLIEMLFATSIFSLVIGGACTFLIGAYRMTKGTFAMTTLAIQQREVRERMLFRAAPIQNGVAWPGVLSGSRAEGNVVVDGSKIMLSASGVTLSSGEIVDPSGDNIQIVRRTSSVGGYLANSSDQVQSDTWLRPLDAACTPQSWARQSTDGTVVFVTLGGALDGISVTNRVVFPRFGVVQATPSTASFMEDQ